LRIDKTLSDTVENKLLDLSVQDGYTSDLGRGRARVSAETWEQLGFQVNQISQFIEIFSEDKRTAASCGRLAPHDKRREIIGLDRFIRENAAISPGDRVRIRRLDSINIARKIVLLCNGAIARIFADKKDYLHQALSGIPATRGDSLWITILGNSVEPGIGAVLLGDEAQTVYSPHFVRFEVQDYSPETPGAVLINNLTQIEISANN
jgi:Cell division protein 48 (CDC48), N-terminal domain